MASPKRKVKPSVTKRYRATLERTVTFRLTTVIEVDAGYGLFSSFTSIKKAATKLLEAERAAGIEREWSTKFVDGNREFFVDEASVQEIEPNIENATAKTDV